MKLEKGATTELKRIRRRLLTAVNCDAKREAENAFNTIDLQYRALEVRKQKNQEKIDTLHSAIFNLPQRNP